jgi:hypothetical protein
MGGKNPGNMSPTEKKSRLKRSALAMMADQ